MGRPLSQIVVIPHRREEELLSDGRDDPSRQQIPRGSAVRNDNILEKQIKEMLWPSSHLLVQKPTRKQQQQKGNAHSAMY